MKRDVLRIGFIVRSQGIKGEVKIQPLTDDVHRFDDLKRVIIEREGEYTNRKITVNHFDDNAVFAYIEGCYTRDAADSLKNAYVCVSREDAIDLPDNSWFISDLIGLDVLCGEEPLGTLCEVIQTGGVDVYRVRRNNGTCVLFPALRRVIRHVDIERGIMELDSQALCEVCVDEN